MCDGDRMREPGKGAAQCLGDARQPHREAAHVDLVEHAVAQRAARLLGAAQRQAIVKRGRRGGDTGLQRRPGIVAGVGLAALRMAGGPTLMLGAPLEFADYGAGVGIE